MWFGNKMIKVAMPCSKFVMYHKCRKIQVSAASNAKMQFDIIAKAILRYHRHDHHHQQHDRKRKSERNETRQI